MESNSLLMLRLIFSLKKCILHCHHVVPTPILINYSMSWWMMMMNCFCGIVDGQKAFSLISSRDHCQRSSPSWISDMPWAGFEPAQNLSSGFVEWSCAVSLSQTYIKIGVHIQKFLSVLLTRQSEFNVTIRFWLQAEDFISFNKHVIGGIGNQYRPVVAIFKVKGIDIHVCCSHSFEPFQVISNKLFCSCQREKMTATTLFSK